MITACSGPNDFSPPTASTGMVKFHPFEDFVVLCVLRKGGELRKPSPHATGLRVRSSKRVSGGLVGLGRISSKVVPYTIKVDALTTCHQPFGIRPVKVEVPNSRVQENLIPRLDSWNRRIHYYQPLDLIRIHCSVGVSHHVADVMCDNQGLVIPQPGYDGTNVFRLRLLVVPAFRLR